jgi:hypothetical protein|tara:strand:+ start:4347 stop:4646 length:300 start_codon:yes stop_codon:yes gene_type:complete
MPVEEAPNDDDVRQSYNFAPGYHGLVYRADGPGHGGQHQGSDEETAAVKEEGATGDTTYKLQSMQWGMAAHFALRTLAHMMRQVSSPSGRSATPTMAAR